MTKGSLELVYWRDASFDLNDDLDPGDFICQTTGWVSIEGRWLRIESEHTPTGPRGITRIPLENVVRRRPLS